MPDPKFTHPRLAALYDVFDDDRSDLDTYQALAAESGARDVLDLGCGTGTLAVRLAAAGHTVTAVDPAAASLAVARAKDPHGRVRWRHGDAATLPATAFDLALMTGNVAQVFLTDDAWHTTLRALRTALRPGGRLVFETRRPSRRVWDDWAASSGTPTARDVPGEGVVEHRFTLLTAEPPLVTFRDTYHFPADGTELTSTSTLRFRGRTEMQESLTATGFHLLEVRQAPDRPGLEHVYLAERADAS